MTQDEIIEMAREAGLIHILDEHAHEYGSGTFENTPYPELEAFANLVAAKNKERILQLIKELRPAIMPLENMGRGKDTQAWFDILAKDIEEKL